MYICNRIFIQFITSMHIKRINTVSLLAFMLCIGLGSCSSSKSTSTTTTNTPSLYDRLGGKGAITAVVEKFVGYVAADSKINMFFANTDIAHLKMELVDQICAVSGGPCVYTGKDMKTAHKGMNINDDQFNALVADLTHSLNDFRVGAQEQSELTGALAGLRGDVEHQ